MVTNKCWTWVHKLWFLKKVNCLSQKQKSPYIYKISFLEFVFQLQKITNYIIVHSSEIMNNFFWKVCILLFINRSSIKWYGLTSCLFTESFFCKSPLMHTFPIVRPSCCSIARTSVLNGRAGVCCARLLLSSLPFPLLIF